ncbi:MAG: FAD-dependent thymidylate synthase [bacterium]|nr:FAD-dependent thymidylate synthase [bacterium]
MKAKTENPYLRKDGDNLVITEEGYHKLSEFLTDPKGQVYAFNNKLSPVIIAAAMARLSRRMGDMRVAILDEFILTEEDDANALIRRVVSEFGDDSVQQLVGVHVVVEDASNLLTKKLEWGRLAAYLEQSTRYIYFDKKDANGRYHYYIPELEPFAKKDYCRDMDSIFDLYSVMVRGVTEYVRKKNPAPINPQERAAWLQATRAAACDAVRPVLPVAAKSTVGIFASAQAISNMIMGLLGDTLPEARKAGEDLLRETRKIIPAFLERIDQPSRGGMITAYKATTKSAMRALVQRNFVELLKQNMIPEDVASGEVRLLDFWPMDEIDLVPEILFEYEHLAMSDIRSEVSKWTQDKKMEVLHTYIGDRLNRRHRPGRALEKAHFEFEIDGRDYGTFRDLQRHRIVDALEWQELTPAYGYDVPELVVEAGFREQFDECFRISWRLCHILLNGSDGEHQYGTLLGHKMRYRFIMNLRQLFHFFELRTSPAGHPGYRRICNEAFTLVKKVYPNFGLAMKFVNEGEDPELGRLAAERATQFKLAQLNSKQKP